MSLILLIVEGFDNNTNTPPQLSLSIYIYTYIYLVKDMTHETYVVLTFITDLSLLAVTIETVYIP